MEDNGLNSLFLSSISKSYPRLNFKFVLIAIIKLSYSCADVTFESGFASSIKLYLLLATSSLRIEARYVLAFMLFFTPKWEMNDLGILAFYYAGIVV